MITISSTPEAEGEPRVALTPGTVKKFRAWAPSFVNSRRGAGIGRKRHKVMLDRYSKCESIFLSLTGTR